MLLLEVSRVQTIDFELRKLDAQQAREHISLLNSFMPNTFFVGGGEWLVCCNHHPRLLIALR